MYSLNLLDPQRKLILRERIRTRRVVRLFIHLFLLLIFQITILLTIDAAMSQRQANAFDELASSKIVAGGKTLPVAQTVKQLNARLKTLKLALDDYAIESILVELARRLPTGITLTSISLSHTTKQLALNGTARTRNDIPDYQRALESMPTLSQIRTDSNINERTNINFTTTALVDFITIK